MAESFVKFILLTNVAATLYMVGLIWCVQIVHYPLFAEVGKDGFAAYEAAHSSLITAVVGLDVARSRDDRTHVVFSLACDSIKRSVQRCRVARGNLAFNAVFTSTATHCFVIRF